MLALHVLVCVGYLGLAEPPSAGPRIVAAPAQDGAPGAAAAPLLTVQRGTLPIILSAPHGGSVRVPGSKDRTTGVTVRDDMTAEVTLLVAQRLTARLGGQPSYVIAQFSRKDADANRAPDSGEAFESPAGRAQYEAFHAALRSLVDQARTATLAPAASAPASPTAAAPPRPSAPEHPRALLIDIHGQKREPDAIVRGTRDGATVAHLVARRGIEAVTGPTSICGLLRAKGYRVLPEDDEGPGPDRPAPQPGAKARHPLNEAFFDGGYIIAHYGAGSDSGIDAIQLELGQMRSTTTTVLARDLGDAIAAFYERHMRAADAPVAAPAPSKSP